MFSAMHQWVPGGDELVAQTIKQTTKTLRGWYFCLAFVCIGLQTDFRSLMRYVGSGKPFLLYLCGQAFNLTLTLIMAKLMFDVFFGEWIDRLLG